ncbi:Transmembrane protein 245 [Habropoda laboriosa]|uniref:Transmembrane protein 245 n=1 Tax=Habropoda laboriosa TaxID=597456 RepID=A0A0L7QM87_9HYME|nr:Transmembrane protein 245 [Habropoda laboriosa]
MDSTRWPMDNLFNMLSGFSTGHEKALKQGIYNAVALFLLCLISAAVYGLYIILSPFVKPLIWALLCGSVLFPFKYSLTTIVKSWFEKTEASHSPLIINLIVLPVQIVDKVSNTLGSFLWKHIKYIVGVFLLTTLGLGAYNYTPSILKCCIKYIILILMLFLQIAVILIGYLSVLYIYWTPYNSFHFCYSSFVIWFMISLYVSNMLGAYQIIVFITLQILYLIGFIYEVAIIMENQELEGKTLTFMEAICFALTNNLIINIQQDSLSPLKSKTPIENINEEIIDTKINIENDKVDTDKYMYGALYACIAFYIIKQLGNYFGLWKIIGRQCNIVMHGIKAWCIERHQALLPTNVRGLYKVGIIIDEKLTKVLKASVDSVVTIAVVLGLLVFTICTSIFITIQVYTEGIHLIQITGEILNSSLMSNPDIDWLPDQWENSVNSVLDNAYTYGRSAISDGIKGIVKDLDPAKADQMEKKVLELWDRLYQAWMMSNESPDLIGPTVDVTAAFSVWDSFKESFGKTPLQLFNMTSIQNFIKENIGTFISSEKTYKPVELTTVFSPISCHRFAVALQEAVIGVFAATFKLASFFGMWTWFIHNLFQVKIVYLPSTFATILGAVPVLDAYCACIPATLELWFTRGPMIAILFFMFHFLPCNIVVTEFYKEIKGGGHPYLTGLSIAGGIFCLGVEGAIFGPLLLCCIMVAINLSRRYLHSPSEEIIPTYSEIKH